jgi:hypothetical protein
MCILSCNWVLKSLQLHHAHDEVGAEYQLFCVDLVPKIVCMINIVIRRVGLAQVVRFLMVVLTNSGLNTRFDMSVIFLANYSFSGRRRPRRQ